MGLSRLLYILPLRLRSVFRRRRVESELEEELRYHLDMKVEENLAKGMRTEDARRSALLALGGLEQKKEECRDMRCTRWLDDLGRDLGYAFRQLRRSPAFAAITVATLAIGIGINTAFFSVVNAVLIRPLPFSNPGELVQLKWDLQQYGISSNPLFRSTEFHTFQSRSQTLTDVAAYELADCNLSGFREAVRVRAARVSAGFFPLLGIDAQLGRRFLPGEDQPGKEHIAILSHELWKKHFGGDRQVSGRTLNLDGSAYTIVGVLPESFYLPQKPHQKIDLWLPLAFGGRKDIIGNPPLVFLLGRLKPLARFETARAELDGILKTMTRRGAPKRLLLSSWRDEITRESRLPLLLFMGAVGFVLMIACCNVANLMLARSTVRGPEVALRSSLGATRLRTARMLLTECLVLSGCGGVIGFALSFWVKELLQFIWADDLAPVPFIPLDFRVLAFAVLLSVATGLVFGLVPVVRASNRTIYQQLSAGRGSAGPVSQKIGRMLVSVEVSLALVLLIGAGLLLRTVIQLQQVDPGYRSENVMSLAFDLKSDRYQNPQQQLSFFQKVLSEIRNLPGVESVALSSGIPLGGFGLLATGLRIEGQPANQNREAEPSLPHICAAVSAEYFETMGIPLLKGRSFDESDAASAPGVAVISSAFARRYFKGQDPIGSRISDAFTRNTWLTIVGVVGDVHQSGLDSETVPQLYRSYLQMPLPRMFFLIRSSAGASGLAGALQKRLRAIDPDQPVFDLMTLEQRLSESMMTPRTNLGLFGSFAVISMLLACIGIYGVVSYSVSRRRNEIAVRMALGARLGDILRVAVSQILYMCLLGIAVGVAGSLALTRYLSSLLYRVRPNDPSVFMVISLLFIGVVVIASYIPARKAARVDPIIALKCE